MAAAQHAQAVLKHSAFPGSMAATATLSNYQRGLRHVCWLHTVACLHNPLIHLVHIATGLLLLQPANMPLASAQQTLHLWNTPITNETSVKQQQQQQSKSVVPEAICCCAPMQPLIGGWILCNGRAVLNAPHWTPLQHKTRPL